MVTTPLVSGDELASVVALLDRIIDDSGSPVAEYATPHYKPLRLALAPFITERTHKLRRSEADEKRETHRRNRKEAHRREQRERALDRKFIDNTRLRSERLQMLASLQEADNIARAPDGMVGLLDGLSLGAPCTSRPTLCDAGSCEKLPSATSEAVAPVDAERGAELAHARVCYICKARFRRLHHYYADLCPACASLNWTKRNQSANLAGRITVLTGARVKIGFAVALRLLRSGATVLATTRFAADAARRFAALPDFCEWQERLHIFGLDLRNIAAVETFCDFVLRSQPYVTDVINNACQTVRRPSSYYRGLVEGELAAIASEDALAPTLRRLLLCDAQCFGGSVGRNDAGGRRRGHLLSLGSGARDEDAPAAVAEAQGDAAAFPMGSVDVNGQQLDLRTVNSWTLKLHEVQTDEAAEALAINALAPFIINARLRPALEAAASHGLPHDARHVVNVSAMEGKFYRYKTPNHPHTNMAKAALNMMTRTCAEELASVGVYMNSVDTGWINDENPTGRAAQTAERNGFQTPLDEIDAAARIVDPIVSVASGASRPVYGQFLKDYVSVEW